MVKEVRTRKFSQQDVIEFLIAQRRRGMETWKRIKIVESLILYRDAHFVGADPKLEDLLAKLQKLESKEWMRADGRTIEEVVGKINPLEPDTIQAFRRSMRLEGKSPNTERAYVKWAK
jgi:hypothetical protein